MSGTGNNLEDNMQMEYLEIQVKVSGEVPNQSSAKVGMLDVRRERPEQRKNSEKIEPELCVIS